MGASRSEFAAVESGVPLASDLGPTLFLMYTYDLPEGLVSRVHLFAYDTICQRGVASETDQCQLQQDLDKLGTWEEK